MYKYEDVRGLHLEPTERCQAACPMCMRNHGPDGGLLHHLTEAELTLDDCRQIFPKKFIEQLRIMYMCGTFGEPIIARDCLEIYEYFRYANPKMMLSLTTNGGARPASWWKDLAPILYNGIVTFSVDGLEDTNDIYRINVQWDRVMESAEAFIGAGGVAEWHFLVFKHNEHQIEEARSLAKKMGFRKFVVKRTSRWEPNAAEYKHLQQPEKKKYVHRINEFIKNAEDEFGSYDGYLDGVEIKCKVKDAGMIYVSAEGLVVPCCWIAGIPIYNPAKKSYGEGEFFKKIVKGDKSLIDAKVHGIKGVLDGIYFDAIEKSWSIKSLSEGRLRVCAKSCSAADDLYQEQFLY